MKDPANLSGVFQRPAPRYYSIDPGRDFLHDLAAALRASIEAEGAELSNAVIYLPTRRAVRALADAFVKTAPNGKASLLPRIRALGDIDEDEFVLFAGAAVDEIDLPPAVSPMERRLILAQMVAARERAFDGHERWAGALAAADELGRLIDSFYTEEVSPDALETIVPDALAGHWRASLDFLSIVAKAWPAHLDEIGRTDPADRRVKLIDRQRRAWEAAPPAHPVIVAGTTGSTPAVARLMKTVAGLPLGCIVLPGLDLSSAERIWEAVDAPHPQSGLKQLLKELDTDRGAVARWPAGDDVNPNARSEIISVALRPADASDSWRDWAASIGEKSGALETALADVELVEAGDEEREADAAAIKIREAVETPDRTAILVTPDRDLARRTARKLRRWNIFVDDSAGVPFAQTPCGTFLRLVARTIIDVSDAVALMAVLRHPLFGGGLEESARRRAVAAMDRALRGLRAKPGVEGLREKVVAVPGAEPALDAIAGAMDLQPAPGASFAGRLTAHLQIAEHLAASADERGADRLWRGEDGEAGAEALAGLHPLAGAVGGHAPEDYPAVFDQLIAGVVVRRRAPTHPRVAILGPLEARLQRADVVILGGLNEGTWPRDAAIDPFLSRPMRKDLGLPSPEQRIGLAAHDFAELTASPEIMLTRAARAGGKPAKPSRWIVRLKNILEGAGAVDLIDRTQYYDILARRLDKPRDIKRISAPQPRPPVEARPTAFHVTRIETLLRDPYSIYARAILRLKKLDAHNEPFDARHAGILFHRILKDFAAGDPPGDAAGRIALLQDLFERYADDCGLTQTHRPFWAPRVREAFAFLADWEGERRKAGTPAVLEGEGEWAFAVDGRDFTLAARADRIDRLKDGSAFVIDYKTGKPPTLKQNDAFSPQLPLTGLIVKKGGFSELGAAPVSGFEYVRVIARKGDKSDDVGAAGAACAEHVAEAETRLIELMRHFNDPDTAYLSQPRPEYTDVYSDYDHLARRRERNAQGGDMGGEE